MWLFNLLGATALGFCRLRFLAATALTFAAFAFHLGATFAFTALAFLVVIAFTVFLAFTAFAFATFTFLVVIGQLHVNRIAYAERVLGSTCHGAKGDDK